VASDSCQLKIKKYNFLQESLCFYRGVHKGDANRDLMTSCRFNHDVMKMSRAALTGA